MGWFDDLRNSVEDLYGGYGERLRSADERSRKFLYESFIDSPYFRGLGEQMEQRFETADTDPGRPIELSDLPYLASPAAPMMATREGRAAVRGFGQQAGAEIVKNITPGDFATLGTMGLGRVAALKGLRTVGEGLSAIGDVTAIGAGGADVVSGIAEGEPLRAAAGGLMATLGAAGRLPARGFSPTRNEPLPKENVEPPEMEGYYPPRDPGVVESSAKKPDIDYERIAEEEGIHPYDSPVEMFDALQRDDYGLNEFNDDIEAAIEGYSPEELAEFVRQRPGLRQWSVIEERLPVESATDVVKRIEDQGFSPTRKEPISHEGATVEPPLGYHRGVDEGPAPEYVGDVEPFKPRMEHVTQNLESDGRPRKPEDWWTARRQKEYDQAVEDIEFIKQNPNALLKGEDVRYQRRFEEMERLRKAAYGEGPLLDWNERDSTWQFNGPVTKISSWDNPTLAQLDRLGRELQNPKIPSDRLLDAQPFFGSDAHPRTKRQILEEVDRRIQEVSARSRKQELVGVRVAKGQRPLVRVDKPAVRDVLRDPADALDPVRKQRTQAAADLLNNSPHWASFEGWARFVHDQARRLIIGSSNLPRGAAQRVEAAPFEGGYISPTRRQTSLGYSEYTQKVDPVTGARKFVGSNVRINPLAHVQGILSDLIDYPSFQDVLQDAQKLAEELLRRVIYTVSHEASHTTGLGHPLKDMGGEKVFNSESMRYQKGALDPGPSKTAAEDAQFERVVHDVLEGYTKGTFDQMMESAKPHAQQWYDLFKQADEIQRGRAEATPAVPTGQPRKPGAVAGRAPTGGGQGVPGGGLPGGAGPRGPIITPRPRKQRIDWSSLPSHGIKEWINARSAAVIHGRDARFRFKGLANETMDWIKRYEAGDTTVPMYTEYKKLMDNLLAEEKRVGVPVKERPNYVYHLWKENPDTVRRTFRRLGIRPDFTNQRIHDTYEAGIKAGLTPKYDNPLDILAERVRRHKKLVADKKFYNLLRAKKVIKPANKAPNDWVEIRHFPFHRYTTGSLEHIQVWKATPNVALAINRYLDSPISSPFRDFWQRAAAVATDIKNVVMSSGVPGTAFNMHGFNIARRIAATRDTTTASLMKAVEMPFRLLGTQEKLGKFVEDKLDEAARFVEAGMRFDIEDHPFRLVEGEVVPPKKLGFWEAVKEERARRKTFVSKTYGGLRKMHEILFEDPLFQKALPSWKLQFAIENEARFIKDGVPKAEATKLAAHQANEVFGGINWVEEGRDPQFQTFLRLAMNAPDWAETNLRIAKGSLAWMRHPKDPKFRVYRNIVRNAAVYYLITNALSRVFSGENQKHPAERHFQLRAGKVPSGRTRYVKGAGTAEDWVRLPYEVIAKLAKGDLSGATDVMSARLHPMTQGLMNVVRNRNYYGRPIFGEDLTLMQQLGRGAKELTDVAAPAYVKAPVAALAGEAGVEEALMKSVEAPVAYARPEGPGRRSSTQGRSGRRSRRSRTRR